jgi:hypothetical protein
VVDSYTLNFFENSSDASSHTHQIIWCLRFFKKKLSRNCNKMELFMLHLHIYLSPPHTLEFLNPWIKTKRSRSSQPRSYFLHHPTHSTAHAPLARSSLRGCLGISGMNGNEGHCGGGISTISQNFPKSPLILFYPLESSISQTNPYLRRCGPSTLLAGGRVYFQIFSIKRKYILIASCSQVVLTCFE